MATSCCSKFSVSSFTGSTRHVYDEIVTDYYDLLRVSSTFVRVLRHPYEIPSILFEITTCLHEFIRFCTTNLEFVRYTTIYHDISTE